MDLRYAILALSCLFSTAVLAECQSNSEGQKFCVDETVFTHYKLKARITGFYSSDRTKVVVLEGPDKGRNQIFETKLLFKPEGCILEFCVGTLVKREEQAKFTRIVVGINKVYNNVLYENTREERYAVQPNRLTAKGSYNPAPTPTPAPQQPIPVGNAWSMSEYVNNDGVPAADAQISTEFDGTKLILSCVAPSSDMVLKIQMNDVLYRAAQQSVDVLGEKLIVQLIIDDETFTLDGWDIIENNMFVQLDTLYPEEISKLKRGTDLDVVITTTDKDGIALFDASFSLKGSGSAIKKAQNYCSDDDRKI